MTERRLSMLPRSAKDGAFATTFALRAHAAEK
jgi:hypothetical protein